MAENMNYILVKTLVRKAIRDIKTDPERTVRNLVDMALQFTDSRFQKSFFSTARKLLADEYSGYYSLVKDTLTKINEETLLTFSMNMGYNGLFKGAEYIRNAEKTDGYNIPWTVAVSVAEGVVTDMHHLLIEQGQRLGIHVWQFFSEHSIHECLAVAAQYPDSAFIIYCGRNEMDLNALDYASELRNIALLIPYDDKADVTCGMLRDAGIVFGLYCTYTPEDTDRIESGELFHDMEQLHPVACVLKPVPSCDPECCERVYQWLNNARMDQRFRTILWEMYADMLLIDEVISEEPCWVGFDIHGQLNTHNGKHPNLKCNIYEMDLPQILKQALPRIEK